MGALIGLIGRRKALITFSFKQTRGWSSRSWELKRLPRERAMGQKLKEKIIAHTRELCKRAHECRNKVI